jgi:hypothetical protein
MKNREENEKLRKRGEIKMRKSLRKSWRATLSLLLAVLMIVAALPALANVTSDEVIYNLGSQEITVGHDAERAEASAWNYKLFDENDHFRIPLENNAFFPYEVQFQAHGEVAAKWFDTPESTIQFGGHTFSVYSEQNDDTKFQQIGVWIDGQYVAARPQAKAFSNPLFLPFSLLPLSEVRLSLDLSAYNRYQFQNVSVSAILSGLTPAPDPEISGEAKVAWARLYYNVESERFQIVEQADNIDLSSLGAYLGSNSSTLELIVGSALQLDDSNIRYIVHVTTNVPSVVESVSVYTETEGSRSEAVFSDTDSSGLSSNSHYEYLYLPKTAVAQKYYLGINLNSAYSAYTVKALVTSFEGYYGPEEEAPEVDVTSKVLNQDLTNTGTGYEMSFDPQRGGVYNYFNLVFYDDETVVGSFSVSVGISLESNGVSVSSSLYDSEGDNAGYLYDIYYTGDVETYSYITQSPYPANAQYYLRLRYYKGNYSTSGSAEVTKAVLGHYNTLAAAAGQADIKEQLFPESWEAGAGYPANFSGAGKNFTIFAEDEVYKITVKAVDGPSANDDNDTALLPNPGSRDIYFWVYGADGLSHIYVLPPAHDSYYDRGFQTVFYTDDVDLSALKPIFGASEDNVYSGHNGTAGTKQESGVSVADFSAGAVQYAVPAADGTSLKNYWVTFVKKHSGGAKLFVNGINGDEGAKREVFLNSVYSNQHDIFLANVGDAALTGLTATLANARNVKLDPYWTVGGANNDTLAAFDSVDSGATTYGELANVAKIRLLPDGEGAVSGTLTITADSQAPIVITLTGYAGNPRLTTSAIPEAVKYVPYAVQILHNNQYSWNTVTMSVVYGSLPAGLELKANGELYGVPKETGTFSFEVEMRNSDYRFTDSYAEYTLVVKDNTNNNVYAETDVSDGYEIITPIGGSKTNAVISAYRDTEWVIERAFVDAQEKPLNEFVDLWLDGVKLRKDVDYNVGSGSTKITIKSQAFSNAGSGTHTVAGEFRNAESEMKKAAQNYTATTGTGTGTSTGTSGGGGGGGSSASTPTVSAANGAISVSYSQTGDTLTLTLPDSKITEIIGQADGTAIFDLSGLTGAAAVTLPTDALNQLVAAGLNVEIRLPDGTFTLSQEAAASIADQATADTLTFTLAAADASSLNAAQSAALKTGDLVFNITAQSGEQTITAFDGLLTVTVPYSGQTPSSAWYLDSAGTLTALTSRYNAAIQTVSFDLPHHFSLYVVGYNEQAAFAVAHADITYIYGQNRVLTSVAISQRGWSSAQTVILAPGAEANLIDALVVAPLAYQANAPILLSIDDAIDPAVIAEIQRLGASKITTVGALSQNVTEQLQTIFPNLEIETLRGVDRFATADLINAKISTPQGTVVVGYNAIADAVSIASWAAVSGYAIHIANPDGSANPPSYGSDTGTGNGTNYILGGPTLVQDIPGYIRIYGLDRYATNQALRQTLSFNNEIIYTADGNTLVDALTGSVLAAKTRSAIVLTPNNDPTGADFGDITPDTKVYGFGGAK